MQCPMPILPHPMALNLLKDAAKVKAIDYSPDFENCLHVLILLINFSEVYTRVGKTGTSRTT